MVVVQSNPLYPGVEAILLSAGLPAFITMYSRYPRTDRIAGDRAGHTNYYVAINE